MSADPEVITTEELAPWLAWLAHEGATVSEGELSHAFGVDRLAVRDIVLRGGEIAKRVRNARVARVKREIEEQRARVAAEIGAPLNARREPYRQALPAVRALLADGRPRTAGDVAQALGLTRDAATQRLRRCPGVERVGRGVWSVAKGGAL